MTTYKVGDVVLVPFPFTDLATIKQRPALVISSSAFNRRRRDVILMAITSHLVDGNKGSDYQLTESEQKAAGLPKPSLAKLGKVVSIDQRLIRKTLGRLAPKSIQDILKKFSALLG